MIAVIAILAALLLPALTQAKEKARAVQCVNNLKQWTSAFNTYGHDSDFIPREGIRNDGTVRVDSWADVRHQASKDVWYNVLPAYLGERPASSYASLIDGQRPKFYENRVFHCPKAKFPSGAGQDNDAFFSLAMNSKLIMPVPKAPEAPEYSTRFAAIQSPSHTPAFLEARVNEREPKVDVLQVDNELGQPSAYASRFAARHSRDGNLAFCDGHVERQPGPKVVETRPGHRRGLARFPDREITWCAEPLVDPNTADN